MVLGYGDTWSITGPWNVKQRFQNLEEWVDYFGTKAGVPETGLSDDCY